MVTRFAAKLGGAIGRDLVRLAALAVGLALPGCASLTTGTEQTIAVTTSPAIDASCTLRNANGSWHVARTPGTVTVRRAYGDLAVACALADGASGDATLTSSVATATYGNILLMGSVVWAAVDAASGAAFAYPDSITVPLKVAAIPVPAAPAALPPGAAAQVDEPQSRLQQLHQLRAEHRISATEYQLRVADIAAAGAIAAPVAVARPAAAPAPAATATPAADDPRSRLHQLRAEHRISAMEYQRRLLELDRAAPPAAAAAGR